MDDSRFDTLTVALGVGRSRRGLARLLGGFALGGSLNRLGLDEVEAKRKRKKKKKKAVSPSCTPTCAGRNCDGDGCGGSCGACSGGQTCQSGICTCPSGQDFCGGTCRLSCPLGSARDPRTCGCCRASGSFCNGNDTCCSDLPCPCSGGSGGCGSGCPGRSFNDACLFGAQCASGYCSPNLVCV